MAATVGSRARRAVAKSQTPSACLESIALRCHGDGVLVAVATQSCDVTQPVEVPSCLGYDTFRIHQIHRRR